MSIFKDMFQSVCDDKFGQGNYSYSEWYAPNTDAVNYTVQFQDQQGQVSITGIEELMFDGGSIKSMMRSQLDGQFQ